MNDAQLRTKLKNKDVGKFGIGDGLYFRVTPEGTCFFIHRYTINKKRREIALGKYVKPPLGLSLAQAKLKLAESKK